MSDVSKYERQEVCAVGGSGVSEDSDDPFVAGLRRFAVILRRGLVSRCKIND